jgi:hypothetical protein
MEQEERKSQNVSEHNDPCFISSQQTPHMKKQAAKTQEKKKRKSSTSFDSSQTCPLTSNFSS